MVSHRALNVFLTLSFSGSSMFSKLNHGFDVVIIDEAAQATMYGVDSICVVTWDEDLLQEKDLARLRDSPYAMVETILYALIFEVEGLACPP